MDLVVPECQFLSLEGVRNILSSITKELLDVKKERGLFEADIKKQFESRPTLDQVISAVSAEPGCKVQFTVGLEVIKKVLMNFEKSVGMNLNVVQETTKKYEQTMKRIIETAQQSLEFSHLKFQKAQKYSKKNLQFVLDHIFQLHMKNKKRRIIENWKKITKNKKEAVQKLLRLTHSHAIRKKTKNFKKWERNSLRMTIKNLQLSVESITRTLESHNKDISEMRLGFLKLQEQKADNSKIKDLEDLALKADVRIMFQDIKNIIKVHTDNLKNKHDEETKAVSQDLRFVKETIGQKADSRHIKEHLDLFLKLRADFLDLNKSHAALIVRMNNFDGIVQKENTDFKLGILDRKIAVMEQRLARIVEEKGANTALGATLCNFPQTKRPVSSVNRTSHNSRKNSFAYT